MNPPNPVRDRPDVRVFTEIGVIAQLSGVAIERLLPDGLSGPQFGVLNHFARRGGEETPAQLADAFQVTRGAMTNTLARLEAQGLVAVRPDDSDGRRKQVSITPAGLATREAALKSVKPRLDAIRAAIPPEDFAAALPFLSRLRAWLDENR
jgi:DNA-binding MarR family transcriptional regulator